MATPERTTQSYGPGITSASKAVLLEVVTALRTYGDALILIGGWAPYFLLQQHQRAEDRFVHVGSIDIDLVLDPAKAGQAEYDAMVQTLEERGYRLIPTTAKGVPGPTSLLRSVQSPTTNKPYTIQIDLLPPHQLSASDGLLARKTKGCEAALTHHTTIQLSGTLPEGGELTVPLRMADVVSSLTMKGIVLGERFREKDAYDIYALAAHYQRGASDVAAAIRPFLEEPLVRESMEGIATAFAKREANGPAWAASFVVSPRFTAEHQRAVTDAFMVVSELCRLLRAPALSAP